MRRRAVVILTTTLLLWPELARAWDDKTHIAIAYIAYRKLSKHARDRVDELLVLHSQYRQWTEGAKVGQAGLMAFLHAATWPDCIQHQAKCPGYVADGDDDGMIPPAVGQEPWQNIGYTDHFMHKYWHFISQPYTIENIELPAPKQPNLETQLALLTDALNSNADEALKSYDLAWVENLVGDLHQPANTISRFSTGYPHGDRNARDVRFCAAPCTENLHAYWDDLLGTEQDFESGIKQGKALVNVQKQTGWVDDVDISRWLRETFETAKRYVYAAPISDGKAAGVVSARPDEAYRKAAMRAALEQVVLAGNRLASLLNQNLK
jgi:S1/P1 nuclease